MKIVLMSILLLIPNLQFAYSEPKKDCLFAERTISLAPHRRDEDPYKLSIPPLEHNKSHRVNCIDIPSLDHQSYKSGEIIAKCDDGSLTTTHSCEDDEVSIECDLSVQSTINKEQLSSLYSNASEANTLLADMPDTDSPLSNLAEIVPSCYAIKDLSNTRVPILNVESQARYSFVDIPACTSSSNSTCYLDPSGLVSLSSNLEFFSKAKSEGDKLVNSGGDPIESRVFVWNKDDDSEAKVEANQINLFYKEKIGRIWKSEKKITLESFELDKAPSEVTSCRLTVSGAMSSYTNTSPPRVNTTNDILVFSTTLMGGDGVINSSAYDIKYTGGPNSTGVWDNPPVGVPSTVTATVTTGSDKKFSCQLVVNPQGKAASVRLKSFGDCNVFSALRMYYYMNKDNTSYEFTPKPITFAGSEAIYGKKSPEIPFRGVVNAVAALNGEIVSNMNGKYILPPLDRRAFSKAVIVARKFESVGEVASSNVLFYGLLDPNDYSTISLYKVPGVEADSNTSIVFQAFLAGAQPSGNKDIRGSGTLGSLEYYDFSPSATDQTPFDRIIPFVNESCAPVFQFSVPVRSDKPLPPELKGITQCMFSRPFKLSDVSSGRVDLSLFHMVPEHAHHQFPIELRKSSNRPVCKTKDSLSKKSCWEINAKNFGPSANAKPFTSNTSCREEVTVMVDKTITSNQRTCVLGGCTNKCTNVTQSSTAKVPITVIKYKSSCPVLEKKNECSENLSIRFSGYNMQMIAALGCAVKYNRPQEIVAATLLNQGVLPYAKDLGGDKPKLFTSYTPAYDKQLGYSCVPCRFHQDAIKAGRSVTDDTAVLPFDQDSNSSRKPLFSFNKVMAPAECVRDIEFEVRYFGSQECDGVSNPPGHFCTSSNLGGQSCPVNPDGGGNVAGRFKIPVCPNSGIETDSISVSWSPIIIDVFGNGINISRDSEMSVLFDIKGNGKKILVDWPINTKEVAFLVLPNKKGEVTSIKELFGDYKAKNGFELLARYDSNKDKTITSKDKIFKDLRLWFDRNRDGNVDEGELEVLVANGVDQIFLEYTKKVSKGVDGQTLYSTFYNSKYKQYYNVGDFYFNGYESK